MSISFVLFLLLADNRPSGKSPVGTVQEPPSKLPGEKTNASVLFFIILSELVDIKKPVLPPPAMSSIFTVYLSGL